MSSVLWFLATVLFVVLYTIALIVVYRFLALEALQRSAARAEVNINATAELGSDNSLNKTSRIGSSHSLSLNVLDLINSFGAMSKGRVSTNSTATTSNDWNSSHRFLRDAVIETPRRLILRSAILINEASVKMKTIDDVLKNHQLKQQAGFEMKRIAGDKLEDSAALTQDTILWMDDSSTLNETALRDLAMSFETTIVFIYEPPLRQLLMKWYDQQTDALDFCTYASSRLSSAYKQITASLSLFIAVFGVDSMIIIDGDEISASGEVTGGSNVVQNERAAALNEIFVIFCRIAQILCEELTTLAGNLLQGSDESEDDYYRKAVVHARAGCSASQLFHAAHHYDQQIRQTYRVAYGGRRTLRRKRDRRIVTTAAAAAAATR